MANQIVKWLSSLPVLIYIYASCLQPAPFPEGCTQIGYNEVAAGAGLTEPSHEDGIVQAKAGERLTFSFKRMERQTQPGEITAHLTNNERSGLYTQAKRLSNFKKYGFLHTTCILDV